MWKIVKETLVLLFCFAILYLGCLVMVSVPYFMGEYLGTGFLEFAAVFLLWCCIIRVAMEFIKRARVDRKIREVESYWENSKKSGMNQTAVNGLVAILEDNNCIEHVDLFSEYINTAGANEDQMAELAKDNPDFRKCLVIIEGIVSSAMSNTGATKEDIAGLANAREAIGKEPIVPIDLGILSEYLDRIVRDE